MSEDAKPPFTVLPFRRAPGPKQAAEASTDLRPMIRFEIGNLEEVVDQAEEALIRSGRGLYQRADKIVAVGETKRITADKQEVPVTRIYERGEHALLEDLTASASFEKYDGRSKAYVLTETPTKIVKVLRERTGRFRLPPLEGITTMPTLRPDGSLIETPGYDQGTGLLYDPGGATFPKISPAPTRGEAEDALHLLGKAIGTFPFVGEADKSVALSGILTACVRRALRTSPLHGFTAPVAGSGKSMLVDVIASSLPAVRPA